MMIPIAVHTQLTDALRLDLGGPGTVLTGEGKALPGPNQSRPRHAPPCYCSALGREEVYARGGAKMPFILPIRLYLSGSPGTAVFLPLCPIGSERNHSPLSPGSCVSPGARVSCQATMGQHWSGSKALSKVQTGGRLSRAKLQTHDKQGRIQAVHTERTA